MILSLPDGFAPDPSDLARLAELGVEVVGVPVGLSLGQSVVYVINVAAASAGPVCVLHGDTLLHGLDMAVPDAVSVGDGAPGYRWGRVAERGGRLLAVGDAAAALAPDGGPVLSGWWFAFADAALLVQWVTRRGGDFLAGLGDYAARHPLRALPAAEWLDFGHASTYHRSRRRITTERAFNRLDPTRRTVVKSGHDARKIAAEAAWFEALPPALRIHAPRFLGLSGVDAGMRYAIEYLHLPALSDLFVSGRLPRQGWARIFDACDEFLSACAAHPAPPGTAEASRTLYADKTLARLEAFARARAQAGDRLDLDAPCRLGGAPCPPSPASPPRPRPPCQRPRPATSPWCTATSASATSSTTPAPTSCAP